MLEDSISFPHLWLVPTSIALASLTLVQPNATPGL